MFSFRSSYQSSEGCKFGDNVIVSSISLLANRDLDTLETGQTIAGKFSVQNLLKVKWINGHLKKAK